MPDSLIKIPVPDPVLVDTTKALTPVPATPPLGAGAAMSRVDSLRALSGRGRGRDPRFGMPGGPGGTGGPGDMPGVPGSGTFGAPADSLAPRRGLFAPTNPDPGTPSPTVPPAPPADTTRRGGGR